LFQLDLRLRHFDFHFLKDCFPQSKSKVLLGLLDAAFAKLEVRESLDDRDSA
jgi:hypothetical protein